MGLRKPRYPLSLAIILTLIIFIICSFPNVDRNRFMKPTLRLAQSYEAFLLESQKRSWVGKMTMLYGEEIPVYESALKLHDAHNALHGYRMTTLRRQLLEGYWSKPAYILSRLLEELAKPEMERLEWLVWFDIDILILNYNIPLEIFLPPEDTYPDINLLVTDDLNGLNNGVFFLRVTEWSVWLMTATLGYQKAQCRPPGKLRTQDQGALENLIKEDTFRHSTMHVPQRWFNAFAGWRDENLNATIEPHSTSVQEGDLLVHFAGHRSTREDTMRKWLPLAQGERPQWQKDLSETTYEEEILKFWRVDAEKEIPKQVLDD